MNTVIRPMTENDRTDVMTMMKIFYASDAVHTNGSDEIFKNDIDACISNSPYLDGYVIDGDGEIMGYGMVAKSFSTEFGKRCMWIEDLYIKPEHRGKHLGGMFLAFVEENYHDCILRLEVEEENTVAYALYKKRGFDVMPYVEMKK